MPHACLLFTCVLCALAACAAALAGSVLPYGPTIAEHVILDAGLDPGMKLKPAQSQAQDSLPPAESNAEAGAGGGLDDEGAREVEGGVEASGIGLGAEALSGGGEKGGKKGKSKGKQVVEATAEQRAAWRVISAEELQALHAALKRLDAWFAGVYVYVRVCTCVCVCACVCADAIVKKICL
eukprot:1160650-Pelagomonas_calceolata.AAC.6